MVDGTGADLRKSLFLRFGGEEKRIALAATGFGSSRRLRFGNVPCVDSDDAAATAVRGHHDSVGLIFAHAEFGLEDRDDEVARRKVIVDENDLVKPRALDRGFDLGLRLDDGFAHDPRIQR